MSKVMVFSLRSDYRWQQNMEKKTRSGRIVRVAPNRKGRRPRPSTLQL